MKQAEPTPERPAPMRLLADLLFRNWGLKAIALVLAAFMFVFTRDEVTRVFTVPLRIVPDPERVLLTEIPETVQVQARGPWARINRLQAYDFGAAVLDLERARPGPLEIDRGGIVMPPGVVLAGIQYDHVDLRFDAVVDRDVEIKPQISGTPAPDYQLVGLEVEPQRWEVRGGESMVARVQQLLTEPLEIEGADRDVEGLRAVVPPLDGVTLVETDGRPEVTIRAVITARSESRRFVVAVAVPDQLDPTGVVPRTYDVEASGPLPDFRLLDAMELSVPVVAQAVRVERGDGKPPVAEVRFDWVEGVPQDLRGRLSLDKEVERFELPVLPPPAPPLDLPAPQ
ncbi:MAG: CdaR family protein [Nannocystaceae bacterium]